MAIENKTIIKIIDEGGILPYEKGLSLQEKLFQENLLAKENNTNTSNSLILCEHEPVYTLGKNGDEKNLLVNPSEIGAVFMKVNRGGDITYHGPGQIVGYPILDLDSLQIGVAEYINSIEELGIKLCALYNLEAARIDGASGVWLGGGTPRARKIMAIGAKVSKHQTMHGFAFNVNTDLMYFNHIVPCGITDKSVTSLQQELKKEISILEVKQQIKTLFEALFQCVLV